ncbi:MAG: TIGR01777 family protein [Opitutaceae bacterium]|nr:TIGR01777 family protein [Opitutaceae bacterium]
MRIAIAGSSGLVGRALVAHSRAKGAEVVRLVRRPPAALDEVEWDPAAGQLETGKVASCDVLVNLAGENIAEGRWTKARKQALCASRLDSTRLLAATIARGLWRPSVWINASAIGYYGNRGEELLDETSAAGAGFLAELCRDWEAATEPAAASGVRVVHLRLGVVLTPEGGALRAMLPWFRRGVGGPVGDGRNWLSWIALEELLRVIDFTLGTPVLAGPVNAVSLQPVRQAEFAVALGRALGRKATTRMPAMVIRLGFGEMGEATVLASQRVRPAALEGNGFLFRREALEAVLQAQLQPEGGGGPGG